MTRQVSDRDGAGKHADAPAVKLKDRPEVDKRETHERGTEEVTRMQTRRQKTAVAVPQKEPAVDKAA